MKHVFIIINTCVFQDCSCFEKFERTISFVGILRENQKPEITLALFRMFKVYLIVVRSPLLNVSLG